MKGVSPLVATIMLIAFTLAVSGILFSWIYQYAYESRETLQACSQAQISVQKAYYNPETGNVNIVVYNTGRVPLTGFSVLVSAAKIAETSKDFLTKELNVEEIGLFPVAYNENMRSLVVQSLQCRNAQDMIGIYDVEGL